MKPGEDLAVDGAVARRCIIDLTWSLGNHHRNLDGIKRLQIECARAILASGGRAACFGLRASGMLFEVENEVFNDLFSVTKQRSHPARISPLSQRMAPGLLARSVVDGARELLLFWRLRHHPLSPTEDNVLLMFGDYANAQAIAWFAAFARSKRAKIITLVHDLGPIRRPELSYDVRLTPRMFSDYLKAIASVSDRVLANSNFTQQDFLRFCGEQNLAAPPSAVVPLASDLDVRAVPELSGRLQAANLAAGPFALMVSTVEPRKNHLFAYQLWRRLDERLGPRSIPLVFAGQRGWLSNDLFVRLENDRQMWGRQVIFVEGPSDAELAWLYSRAAFTLYPTEFEGWGLPITESLSFGTHCLAADNSSLREASQGLAWHADTLDGRAWLEEAERCIVEPDYLQTKRAMIASRFVKRRWSDFTTDVMREVTHLVSARDNI